MINTILGSKRQMGQAFIKGTRIPVTKVYAGPCVVTQVKNDKKDGYAAIQLGFGEKKIKNITKPMQGHLKGATSKLKSNDKSKSKKAPRFLREVKVEKDSKIKVGDIVKVSDIFSKGDLISVTGTSKGKGFAGVMKRWGFAGGPRTHGQSDRPRSPGSIGQGTTPGRVHKGKKMPGRMGTDRVTVKNIRVVEINEEENWLTVSGPVPGAPRSLLIIRKLASGKLDELVTDDSQQKVVEGKPEEGEGEKEQSDKSE